jgi:hypothetical protein
MADILDRWQAGRGSLTLEDPNRWSQTLETATVTGGIILPYATLKDERSGKNDGNIPKKRLGTWSPESEMFFNGSPVYSLRGVPFCSFAGLDITGYTDRTLARDLGYHGISKNTFPVKQNGIRKAETVSGGSWNLLKVRGAIKAGKKVRHRPPPVRDIQAYQDALRNAGDDAVCAAIPGTIEEVSHQTFVDNLTETNMRIVDPNRSSGLWCLGANYPGSKLPKAANADALEVCASLKQAALTQAVALALTFMVEAGMITINAYNPSNIGDDHKSLASTGNTHLQKDNQAIRLTTLMTHMGIAGFSAAADPADLNHMPHPLMKEMIRFMVAPNMQEFVESGLLPMFLTAIPDDEKKSTFAHFLGARNWDAHVAAELNDEAAMVLGPAMESADDSPSMVLVSITK